jgi:hypothetical protein
MAGADPMAQVRTVPSGNLIAAIRGPVMLITVGVLFAIDHLGVWSFGRTWPVLLIVIGLLKLAEHLKAKASAGPQ